MNLSVLEVFKRTTGYDIESFFNDYNTFISSYYPLIVDYYNGGSISDDSFNYLDKIKRQINIIEPLIDQYSNAFNATEYWNLNDIFSSIQTSIFTVDNLGRWLRSSRTDRFSQNIKISYIQRQNQTLESISRSFGFNGQDDWVDLSIQNQIIEEDYTNTGGKMLNASFPNNSSFELENIVDTLSETNIYGKDLLKELTFEDGDLKVLQGKESLEQTFNTIMSTKAGSIPEFPQDGLPDYLVGSNQNILQYPTIFRSFLSIMQKDKRFTSFEILNIKKDQDMVFIETQTKTITGDTFIQNIPA